MSLAHDLYGPGVEGSVARPLPKETTQTRPARKAAARKSNRPQVIAIGAAWLVVMSLVLLLVHRHTEALAEVSALTQIKDELAATQKANQELEGQLDLANSVGRVEEWAKAKGMVRAAKVNTVKGDASAVVSRPAPPATPAESDTVVQESLWGVIKSYLARIGTAVQSAR